MIKLNSNKRISKKQLGGNLATTLVAHSPELANKVTGLWNKLFSDKKDSTNLIAQRKKSWGTGNPVQNDLDKITPNIKEYEATLNLEEKRLHEKYKDFYHVQEGLDSKGNLMNIEPTIKTRKDAYDPWEDYKKNEGSCKGLGCYELIIDDNRDIIPANKLMAIKKASALAGNVPLDYDGIVDEFVNNKIATKLKDRNQPYDRKVHTKLINDAIKRGDKVFFQKLIQDKNAPDFIEGHAGYFTQPYIKDDKQKGFITFASESDGLTANHFYDFDRNNISLDAMGIAVIPKKKKK